MTIPIEDLDVHEVAPPISDNSGDFLRASLFGAPEMNATNPLLEKEVPGEAFSQLFVLYQRLPRDHRFSMLDVACNIAFVSILQTRRIELQRDLTNIDPGLAAVEFKAAYNNIRTECLVIEDIIYLLAAIKREQLPLNDEHQPNQE